MKPCAHCNRIHIGSLMFATPMTLFLFSQEFEQWCDINCTDQELAAIRSLPLKRSNSSPLQAFLGMTNRF